MKKNIHPKVHNDTLVVCACGNSFTTSSTEKEIKVEICSQCHPFYTGQQKYVDTEGRIDKFEKKLELSRQKQKLAGKSKKKNINKESNDRQNPSTIKEMLAEARKDL